MDGGLGPGVVATTTAALAAMYFVFPPAGLAVGQPGDLVSVSLFVATGRAEAALATERAERLDAIINTTVDGIIVMDATGMIEAFNRGAERLFRYPASEAISRNVKMLMPSPYHEEHDAYLGRYLNTGVATIIGSGLQVTGRRRDARGILPGGSRRSAAACPECRPFIAEQSLRTSFPSS